MTIYAIYAHRHCLLLWSEHSLIKAEVNDISLQKAPKTVSLKPRCHKYKYILNTIYHGFSQDSVGQSLNGFCIYNCLFFYLYTVHTAHRQFQLWLLINIMWSLLYCHASFSNRASVYSGRHYHLNAYPSMYFNLIFNYFYSISAQCSLFLSAWVCSSLPWPCSSVMSVLWTISKETYTFYKFIISPWDQLFNRFCVSHSASV